MEYGVAYHRYVFNTEKMSANLLFLKLNCRAIMTEGIRMPEPLNTENYPWKLIIFGYNLAETLSLTTVDVHVDSEGANPPPPPPTKKRSTSLP